MKTFHKYSSRQNKKLMSEINVTPFVDVMLVLLIVFMITAPLLKTGVEIESLHIEDIMMQQNVL